MILNIVSVVFPDVHLRGKHNLWIINFMLGCFLLPELYPVSN